MFDEESNSCDDARHFAAIGKKGKENSDPDLEYKFKKSKKKSSKEELLESQMQCYKRLSDLLEKSKCYSMMLLNRIDDINLSAVLDLKNEAIKKNLEAEKLKNNKSSSSVKKRGRPRKRKNDEVDQLVPECKLARQSSGRLDSRVGDSQKDEELPSSSSSSMQPSSQDDFCNSTMNNSSEADDKKLDALNDEKKSQNTVINSNSSSSIGGVKISDDAMEKVHTDENTYKQPVLVSGGTLRKYQLDGVSWLMKLYINGVNGILADEMGLGKTIQCISLIADLICIDIPGPFLICGPLSTLYNWANEFKTFAPEVPYLLYYGNKTERMNLIPKIHKPVHVPSQNVYVKPVVITSYEVVMKDQRFLSKLPWQLLIIDEGHRIKNSKCKLIKELNAYTSPHRLLLTGTPLQNNLSELWTLLNFLIPEIFNHAGSFETWFDVNFLENVDNADEQIVQEEQKSNTLSKIHQILTPFMLRRLKTDVDIVIPPKKELLVVAPFAEKQKNIYKSIVNRTIAQLNEYNNDPYEALADEVSLADDCETLMKSRSLRASTRRKSANYKLAFADDNDEMQDEDSKSGSAKGDDDYEVDDDGLSAWVDAVIKSRQESESLRSVVNKNDKNSVFKEQPLKLCNILSLLRRCCNHPYLIKDPRLEDDSGKLLTTEDIVECSGKLKLADRMLKKLKQKGHRVLIFSQSTQLMNLLEDYCSFRKYKYCRLDGAMKINDRQDEIQRFNDEDIFIFMLSTRAGGLGINLTRADTVIIYDSDWNPQCDLQAQDRCHRIGQINPVVVYRLVAANSIDQLIVERANAKRKMEKMIIHKGKFKSSWDEGLADTSNTGSSYKFVDLNELVKILKETDYDDVIRDDTEMSDEKLDSLLDRSDLIQVWNDRKSGVIMSTSDSNVASNCTGLEK
ncbi:hypothetical protein HELRODRAFT_99073 [Helobdella robusta]|uniref:Proliferation-associated SNF2-like protein n=1 Tax=Helobdella robusta TaxID=6412 RepID=T1G9Q8_HELRO|nr:hypothetical protein HELRODRAFT_99073 [Helobdella robusta]ESO05188.1 hypothetical protein HELRODRAFT_99073 [Helobdella robusta]